MGLGFRVSGSRKAGKGYGTSEIPIFGDVAVCMGKSCWGVWGILVP